MRKTSVISKSELKILLNEYNLCNERIESFIKRQDTLLQISMAIIGGALAFTISNNIADELYIVIPLIPIVLFTHILYHYTRVISNQGYREYLQDKLNNYVDIKNEIKYTSMAKEFLLNKNPMTKINSIIFPSIILFSILYSIFMSNFNITVIIANIFNFVFIVIIGLMFLKFTKNLNEKVNKFCEGY